MMQDPRLFVVMSTYNGARHLDEQVASLQAQTWKDWTLLVRDDGSADGTLELLHDLAARDSRIRLIHDQLGNLGPARSFATLLETARDAGAAYVALCDQDDIWHPEKLARQLQLIRRRESERGAETPLLAHSDLEVVDETLRVVHRSYGEFQGLGRPPTDPLNRLLVQNFVTGCSTLINRALLCASLPVPRVIMHDWWLALCAAAFGELLYVGDSLVRYRQHASNAVGSRGRWHLVRTVLERPVETWRTGAGYYADAARQACELARRIGRERARTGRPVPQAGLVDEYCSALTDAGAWRRLAFVRRHRIAPHYRLYPLYYYARVLCEPRSRSRTSGP